MVSGSNQEDLPFDPKELVLRIRNVRELRRKNH